MQSHHSAITPSSTSAPSAGRRRIWVGPARASPAGENPPRTRPASRTPAYLARPAVLPPGKPPTPPPGLLPGCPLAQPAGRGERHPHHPFLLPPSTSPPVSRRHPRSRVRRLTRRVNHQPRRPSSFPATRPGAGTRARLPIWAGPSAPPERRRQGRTPHAPGPPPNAAKRPTDLPPIPCVCRLYHLPPGKPATPPGAAREAPRGPERPRAPTSTHFFLHPAAHHHRTPGEHPSTYARRTPYRSSSSHPVAPRQAPPCRAPYPPRPDSTMQSQHSAITPAGYPPAPPEMTRASTSAHFFLHPAAVHLSSHPHPISPPGPCQPARIVLPLALAAPPPPRAPPEAGPPRLPNAAKRPSTLPARVVSGARAPRPPSAPSFTPG